MPAGSISNGFTGCLKKITRKLKELYLKLVVIRRKG